MVVVSKLKQLLGGVYNYKEALERQNIKQENVEALREKIKLSEHVPKFIVDKQLLLFLNVCASDVDKSAKMIDNYYKIKKSAPEFFANRHVDSKKIQTNLDNLDYVALPITPDNCHLMFHRLSSYDPKVFDFDSASKALFMLLDIELYHQGPRSGMVVLFDLQGAGFWHLLKPSLSSMRKGIKYIELGMPVELKAIHVINSTKLFKFILAIVRPLMRMELLKKIHFHPTNMDFEQFYRDCIPKSHLPSDFGGDLKSVSELHNEQRKLYSAMRDYFIYEELQASHHFDEYANESGDKGK